MSKRSVGITAIGYGLSLVYGIGLAIYLGAFIVSFVDQGAVLQSALFTNEFNSLEEFQRYAVIIWVLCLPQLIGLLGVLNLKEWGRKLVVFMNIVSCVYVIYRMGFVVKGVDPLSIALILIYIGIIAFLSWSKIKDQFISDVKTFQKRILIVDDDRGLLKLVKSVLTRKGFHVYAVNTGEKGLRLTKKVKPDLVILDVILPGIKGRDVCALLKQDERTKNIPIIFLTSKQSDDDIKAELEAGAVAHLTKPLDLPTLIMDVRKILGV
ncbi:MAG: response regulator [Candidatus Omnitrophota bacterium]